MLLTPAAARADEPPSSAYSSVLTLTFDPTNDLCPPPKVFKQVAAIGVVGLTGFGRDGESRASSFARKQ